MRKLIITGIIAVLIGSVWVNWANIIAWWYVFQLSRVNREAREVWVERAAGMESAVLPGLLSCLRQGEACENVGAAIQRIGIRWEKSDPRWNNLVDQLAAEMESLSGAGQQTIVEVSASWLDSGEGREAGVARILQAAMRVKEPEVRSRSLALGRKLRGETEVREIVQLGLQDAVPGHRIAAIRLASDLDFLETVVPLLADPVAGVRKEALLAIGFTSEEAFSTDDLLPLLHDPEVEIRRLCESMLRARNLTAADIELARLVCDAQPGSRMQVLERLGHAPDVDVGAWLERLSHDPVPAVRAAALRAGAMAKPTGWEMRMAQMEQTDPSPTVRQLARHYMSSSHRR